MTSSNSVQTEITPKMDSPREITASILRRIGMIDILNTAQLVCTTWRSVCKDPSMWRSINMDHGGHAFDLGLYGEEVKMCKNAVDRSCGGVTDVNIEHYGTDDLLCYIADRSSQLKRIRIEYCYDITDYGLSELVRKSPLLEELAVFCCKNVMHETLEVAGQSCPLLRSLKFNSEFYNYVGPEDPDMEYNEEALAIAKNMPHLRHLELIGNELMTNEGLRAILDGCSHLESLDLRLCSNVSLGGNLGKRCAAQIKNLQRPNDPLPDCHPSTRSIRSQANYYNHYVDPWSDGYVDPWSDDDCDYENLFFDDFWDRIREENDGFFFHGML